MAELLGRCGPAHRSIHNLRAPHKKWLPTVDVEIAVHVRFGTLVLTLFHVLARFSRAVYAVHETGQPVWQLHHVRLGHVRRPHQQQPILLVQCAQHHYGARRRHQPEKPQVQLLQV